MERLKDLFISHENWLMERVLTHAKERNYAQFTSTLVEPWRQSVAGLTATLLSAIDTFGLDNHEFSPDDTFVDDPVSAFAVEESRLHRKRGISLAMFLGLLKYYRQAYIALVCEKVTDISTREIYRRAVARFFDRLEIALCVDWTGVNESVRINEMQTRNQAMANEKNKFLTLFESLTTPVFLLDKQLKIEAMNLSAAEFLGIADTPGQLIYARGHAGQHGDEPEEKEEKVLLTEMVPWLGDALTKSCTLTSEQDCRFDVSADTALGPRHFSVSVADMSHISDKYSGFTVVLDDITFRVDMKRQMETERNRATHYLDIIGSILLALDASGNITLINKAGLKALGYEESELYGQNWVDMVIPEEQRDEIRDYLYEVIYQGADLDAEHTNYVTTKDGDHRLISWNNQLLRNEEGMPIGVLSSGTDITEQYAAEQALAEKELWLRNTFMALGEAVLILTPEKVIMDANAAAEDMFQISSDEMTELPIETLHISPGASEEYGKLAAEALAKDDSSHFEFQLKRRDGEIFPTENSVARIVSDDGMPLGMVNVIRDITERKEAETILRRSEEKFRRIFESIEEGFMVTDLKGFIQMVNPATCTTLGYDESELIGAKMSKLYAVNEERKNFRRTIEEKGSVRGHVLTAMHKSGTAIIVEANAHLVRDDEGTPLFMEGTFRDITERIEAEKILREREKQYRAFFENNHAIMLLVDPQDESIVDANPAASDFYGYPVETMRQMNMKDISAMSQDEIFEEMADARKTNRAYFIFKHRLEDGELRDVEIYSGPILVQGKQLLYSVIHDVTERIRLEKDMKRMATTDALTGASNRHQFFRQATHELGRSTRYKHPLSVLMLDIDYFKSINDTYGHHAGDVVLKQLSALSIDALRETDLFGRLGGEEFAAILPETDEEGAILVADRLRQAIADLSVYTSDSGEIRFTASIGVTQATPEDRTIEEIINRADEALYKAKRMGRNRVEKS